LDGWWAGSDREEREGTKVTPGEELKHIPSNHFLVIFPIKGQICSFLFLVWESLISFTLKTDIKGN